MYLGHGYGQRVAAFAISVFPQNYIWWGYVLSYSSEERATKTNGALFRSMYHRDIATITSDAKKGLKMQGFSRTG